MLKQKLVKLLNKLPYIRGIKGDLVNYEKWGQPGHFYNPIPNIEEVKKYEYSSGNDLDGIALNEIYQLELLETFKKYYSENKFPHKKDENFLYYFDNPNYSYADSLFYYSILRTFNPKKVIEIGSGFSSCVLLDTNRSYLNNQIEIKFIEPYPQLLESLTSGIDGINILPIKVQEVELEIFSELTTNDILFIDSSHVLKAGSDLNHILFKILPRLNSGVLIHFHDIFNGFKYPENWITKENRAWNEIYALRLFLMHNNDYEIVAFNTFMIEIKREWFEQNMPNCLINPGGSIWLRKLK